MTDVRTVALLGGGIMAAATAPRLRAAGLRLRLFNRTAAALDDFARPGDVICATATEAATGAEVVWSFVHDDTASTAVWCGPCGALEAAEDALVIESSTISIRHAGFWTAYATDCGARALVAPVTGSRPAAEGGELVVFAGGPAEHIDAASVVFDGCAKEVIRFRTATEAAGVKLLNNALAAVILTGLAETLTVAPGLGLDPARLAGIFARHGWAAPVASGKGTAMITGDHRLTDCSLALIAKDLRYACEALGTDTPPLIGDTTSLFRRAVADGLGEREMSAIILTPKAFHDHTA